MAVGVELGRVTGVIPPAVSAEALGGLLRGLVVAGEPHEGAGGDVDRDAPQFARGTQRLVVDYATAELVKVAANAFLATKISFINAVAELCEQSGADVVALADALGMDARIGGQFLAAGLGFGGGCLPKDLAVLGMSVLPFVWNLYHSYRYGEVTTADDPWGFGNSLEWACPTPPPA